MCLDVSVLAHDALPRSMRLTAHPYRELPTSAFWRKAVSGVAVRDVDPIGNVGFTISPTDRVATAGSCFAQHIARHLREAGFHFLVTETAHPIVPAEQAEAFGYGVFTARYGNIYTARQLLQLFQRAYGLFVPEEDVWQEADGCWTDPFRPQIQPGRFLTRAELEADRTHHFGCIRRAFNDLDVFVFTLGLTESWSSRQDDAVYPLCPGVGGGKFDPARHVFRNASVADVVADLISFIDLLRGVNPAARIMLTVSPVPLVATASGQHVLTATAYSKSVLRVAADEVSRQRPNVVYFPSFEIITGNFNRGIYFADDCRSVTEEGVEHVMRTFLRNHAEGSTTVPSAPPVSTDPHTARMAQLVKIVCDEEALDDLA